MDTHAQDGDASGGLNGSRRDIEESRYAKIRASLTGSDDLTNDHDKKVRPLSNSLPSGSQSSRGGGSGYTPSNNSSDKSFSNWSLLLCFLLFLCVLVYFLSHKNEEKLKSPVLEVTLKEALSSHVRQVPVLRESQQAAVQHQALVQPVVVLNQEAKKSTVAKQIIRTEKSFSCPSVDSVENGFAKRNIEYINADTQSLRASAGCVLVVVQGTVSKVEGKRYRLSIPEPSQPGSFWNCGDMGGSNDADCTGFVNYWSGKEMRITVLDGGYVNF